MTYYVPRGGLPPQTALTTDRARFTEAYAVIPASTLSDITASYPVIDPWESPVEWQDPHPALVVNGGIAYVTEPASDAIHAVDLETGKVLTSADLPGTPNEIAVAAG